MLVIRQEQFDALGLERYREWEEKLLAYMAAHYPEDRESLGEADSRGLARHTLRSAERLGIGEDHAVTGLLGLYVEFGRELELAPYRQWALRLMNHPKLPGVLKIHLVRERLSRLTQGRRMVRHQEPA